MKLVLHKGGNDRRELERAHALGVRTVEADIMLCFVGDSFDGAVLTHPAGLRARTPQGHLAASADSIGVRLEALCDELERRDMRALLDVKVAGTVARVAELIAPHAARLVVCSFLGAELELAAERGLETGCIVKHDPTAGPWRALKDAYRCSTYLPDAWYLGADTVELAHRHGVQVVPWDVDDPEQARAMQALGVDAVITSEPEALLASGVADVG